MAEPKHSRSKTLTYRDSLLKAYDEGRFDDMVLLLANCLRTSQETISPHARASLPVDASKASPMRSTKLTEEEINLYDIRDIGWYLVAVRDHRIVGAERFKLTGDEPNYKDLLLEYMNSIMTYFGIDAQVFAAYHSKGMLVEWQFLSEFKPEERHY